MVPAYFLSVLHWEARAVALYLSSRLVSSDKRALLGEMSSAGVLELAMDKVLVSGPGIIA